MAVKSGTWDTLNLRVHLYSELRRRCGSIEEWGCAEATVTPMTCLTKVPAFNEFIDDMVKHFNNILPNAGGFTAGGVANQIAFALTTQNTLTGGHVLNWMKNATTALSVGIIRAKDLPDMILK